MNPTYFRCVQCKLWTQGSLCKFRNCDHFICWDCYFELFSHGISVNFEEDCQDCQLTRKEPNYTEECPTCFVDYAASNISRAEHNCLDDEGIFDCEYF